MGISFPSNIGRRRPPSSGMLGPALMAFLPDSEIERLLERSPLQKTAKDFHCERGFQGVAPHHTGAGLPGRGRDDHRRDRRDRSPRSRPYRERRRCRRGGLHLLLRRLEGPEEDGKGSHRHGRCHLQRTGLPGQSRLGRQRRLVKTKERAGLGQKAFRVDMQVRTVRMEKSRPLAPSSPHAARSGDTPLVALPSEGCVGTLLSLLCFRRGVPIIILGQYGSDCIQISRFLHAHRPLPRNRSNSHRFRH